MQKGFQTTLPFYLAVITGLTILFSGCRREEELFDPKPPSALRFSEDTLFFDTVFTTQKTATYRLKVYNPNPKTIRINSVYLNGFGGKFPFTFHINGRLGPTKVENVELLGKDSAYVLVSANIDAQNDNLPFLVQDSLCFQIEGRPSLEKVQIVAYGQDATYFRNQKLDCNSIWTRERPIIIMDTVSIQRGCTLTVEAGSRIYGYNGAALLVRGSLVVMGNNKDTVTFQGWRRESYYSRVPGQWFGIWIFDGSAGNDINFCLIKNAYRALQVGEVGKVNDQKSTLLLRNSRIQNVVDYGVLGLQSGILAINNQFADCGEIAFAGYQGGAYELYHNTIGESGNNPFRRETPLVAFTDHFPPNDNWAFGAPAYAKLVNNIIMGSENNELNFVSRIGARFDSLAYGNIIKSKDYNYFANGIRLKMNQNVPPGARFKDPLKYNFRPDSIVFAQAFGAGVRLDTMKSLLIQNQTDFRNLLKEDISGNRRKIEPDFRPDAGAYQKNN